MCKRKEWNWQRLNSSWDSIYSFCTTALGTARDPFLESIWEMFNKCKFYAADTMQSRIASDIERSLALSNLHCPEGKKKFKEGSVMT